jgi:UDPglucose 6-dehydrogenase
MPLKITVVGTGYVGLVTGVCFSEYGFDVTCVDTDTQKIEMLNHGEIPIFEPGLRSLLERNALAGRLHFTTQLGEAVPNCDVVIIAVGTPPKKEDGQADMQYVHSAAAQIAKHIRKYTVVIIKSTVPVGTGEQVQSIISKENPSAAFDMVSNPEFLREGNAINDFMKPDRVIVGVESVKAKETIAKLYHPLGDVPILYSDIKTAEFTKYAANCFLAMKIGYINEIADLCERLGANVQDVAKGIGMDPRIGNKFLQPGPGFGGSCFPKDTMALIKTAQQSGAPISIIESVITSNVTRKHRMAKKITDAMQGVKGKTIAVLGLTFKPNTDDMRESASLVIIPDLIESGAKVRVFDPQGMKEAKHHLKAELYWAEDMYDCMDGADSLVILTEWNEFGRIDLKKAKQLLKTPLLVDLRNMYSPETVRNEGFNYVSIGRK